VRQLVLRLTFITVSLAGTAFSIAQENPDKAPEADVESVYDKMDQQTDQDSKKEEADQPAPIKKEEAEKKAPLPEAKTITDLNQLQPFSDIAVIERKFLPKTKRFELSLIGITGLNNPFFNNFGGTAKGVYYFTEKYGLELIGTGLAIMSRQVTDDLANKNNIHTSNEVTPRTFFGGGLKWNPIYGKVSLLNKSIVPFDLSFSIAGGMTQTDQHRSEPTLHIGTSQVFAIKKSFGVRWDLDWNFYDANAIDQNGNPTKVFHNDLFLGIGVAFYFPEASYR
jgi:outer membrane beta-barrel protein